MQETIFYLLLMQTLIVLFNLLLSAFLYHANREKLFKHILIFWSILSAQFCALAINQKLGGGILLEAIIAHAIASACSNLIMLQIIHNIYDQTFEVKKFLIPTMAGAITASILAFTGFSFVVVASTSILFISFTATFFLYKIIKATWSDKSLIKRLLIAIYFIQLLHLMNYPFLRTVEWFSPYGFTLWNSLLVGFAVLLPLIVVRKNDEAYATNLKDNEEEYRVLYESSQDAIILQTQGGEYIRSNPAASKLFNLDATEGPITLDQIKLSPECQSDGTNSAIKWTEIEKVVLLQGSYAFEWIYKRHDDSEFEAIVILNRVDLKDEVFLQTTIRDITKRKREQRELAEHRTHLEEVVEKRTIELKETSDRLIEASRQAGMSEIATGVLHNVGNILNSVNISVTTISDNMRESVMKNFSTIVQLIQQNIDNIGEFLTKDSKGKVIPEYLIQLSNSHEQEKEDIFKEVTILRDSIEHIKEIINVQQTLAGVTGFMEEISISDIIQQSLQINLSALQRYDIDLIEDIDKEIVIISDKSKILQIITNFIRNAKDALNDTETRTIKVSLKEIENESIKIEVSDSGEGIDQENLSKVFSYGFSTKKNGHGFGLHSAALAAKELGGSVQATSDGPKQGSTFILILPKKTTSKPLIPNNDEA